MVVLQPPEIADAGRIESQPKLGIVCVGVGVRGEGVCAGLNVFLLLWSGSECLASLDCRRSNDSVKLIITHRLTKGEGSQSKVQQLHFRQSATMPHR